MPTIFQQLVEDPLVTLGILALTLLMVIALVLPLVAAKLYVVYFLLTLPLRRNERARLFLDLLELGIAGGHAPERAVINAARSRDRILGGKFHQLARHLESGMKLSIGLELVPDLLPRAVAAMLRAGEQLGDVWRVLPACRQLLRDGNSQVRGALNYLLVIWFCVTPVLVIMLAFFRIKIAPVFQTIFGELYPATTMPKLTAAVFAMNDWAIAFAGLVMGVVLLMMICYLGGPRLMRYLNNVFPGFPDAIVFRIPWRRHRLRRDFSAMLAVLLDAGLPEAEAVRLSAEATANRVMLRLATRVRTRLTEGVALPEALKALDDAGELHWRLANARPAHGGFSRALAGWHAALDARAFQLEQAAAQLTTTTLVLFNGVIVAAFVFAVYLAIINLIQGATLW